MNPIGYTYEADIHCEDCAVARFGEDCEGVDREGNPVGAVFDWDEFEPRPWPCGTCGAEID